MKSFNHANTGQVSLGKTDKRNTSPVPPHVEKPNVWRVGQLQSRGVQFICVHNHVFIPESELWEPCQLLMGLYFLSFSQTHTP